MMLQLATSACYSSRSTRLRGPVVCHCDSNMSLKYLNYCQGLKRHDLVRRVRSAGIGCQPEMQSHTTQQRLDYQLHSTRPTPLAT
eukprot:m.33849 g.33849  ORF g.33849 m.33849 type:complete len:85 (-) comp12261_c0_seq4:1648-1902(-)